MTQKTQVFGSGLPSIFYQPVVDLNRQETWSPINCYWALSCEEQKGTTDPL